MVVADPFLALVALPCQPWMSTPALLEPSILNLKASVSKGIRSSSLIFVALVSDGGHQVGWLVWVPTSAVSAASATASNPSNPPAGEFVASVVAVAAAFRRPSGATVASSSEGSSAAWLSTLEPSRLQQNSWGSLAPTMLVDPFFFWWLPWLLLMSQLRLADAFFFCWLPLLLSARSLLLMRPQMRRLSFSLAHTCEPGFLSLPSLALLLLLLLLLLCCLSAVKLCCVVCWPSNCAVLFVSCLQHFDFDHKMVTTTA